MKTMDPSVTFDEALRALADIQRRSLLVALLDHDPQDDTPPVVEPAADEGDAVSQLVTMDHVHHPKLEEYGFISWNRETHEVSKGPKFAEIEPLLELLAEHEDELPDGWL